VVASSSSASDAAADPLPAPHGNKVVFTTTAHPIKVSVNAHVASAATSVPTPKATPPPAWVYSCLWAGYIVPFVMLTFLPFWRATRWVARSYWALLPLGAIYLYLMPLAWEPGTLRLLLPGSLEVGLESLRLGQWNPQFIPNLDGIMYVFTKNHVSVAALVAHLLAGNLFAGRYVYGRARLTGTPAVHSIALCSVFSLFGLASHFITEFIWKRVSVMTKKPEDVKTFRF